MARCVVLGATGHVGSRLVDVLLNSGHDVRCLVRDTAKAASLDRAGAKLIEGDALDRGTVRAAVSGMDVAYFLVHSLGRDDFADRDQRAAKILVETAASAQLRQIVYLGGLGPADPAQRGDHDDGVSAHLASRAEVGAVMIEGLVPAVVLRASMILGDGSASFELLRHMVHSSPVLPAPSWIDTRIQPIALRDVVHYLAECAELDPPRNGTVDIGGPEVVTYRELVQRYARMVGLPRRVLVPAPSVLTKAAGLVIDALTPVSAAMAEPLLESLRHDMVCGSGTVQLLPPAGGLTGIAEAIVQHDPNAVVPCFSGPSACGPQLRVERSVRSDASVAAVWDVVEGIGGKDCWYLPWGVWTALGLADHLLGGVGMHRLRPAELEPGALVDAWRVVELDRENQNLLMVSEWKVPGKLWLKMTVTDDNGGSRLCQVLTFNPRGVAGQVYWHAQRYSRALLMTAMLRNIVRAAERRATALAA